MWLDDLERFLGPGGLTRVVLAQLLSAPGHHVVLATLRAAEHGRLTDPVADAQLDSLQRPGRDAREVIDQARIFRLPRIFTQAEQARAHARSWDPRIADATAHAETYGVAEYLAAGPRLLATWQNAWAAGTHPRAAALVAAAVDCRRVGLAQPLPRELLEQLHEQYMAARGGMRLRPESPPDAWRWATAARGNTTTSLLYEDRPGDGVVVFDYLVDRLQRHPTWETRIPALTLLTVVEHATAAEAEAIGRICFNQDPREILADIYQKAIQRSIAIAGAEHRDTWWLRRKLADAQFDEGHHDEAEAEYRLLVGWFTNAFGAEHADTLSLRSNLGTVMLLDGRPREAEAAYRAVLDARAQQFGPDHPATLQSRILLAWAWQRQGRLDEAVTEYRAVNEAFTRTLGPDHPSICATVINVADALRDQGKYQQAERAYREALEARMRTLGPDHPNTLRVMALHAAVLPNLDRVDEALAAHCAVLERRQRILGPDHPDTRETSDALEVLESTTFAAEPTEGRP